jgi:hypothetical protein
MTAAIRKKRVPGKIYCAVCPDWEIKQPAKCSNTMTHRGAKKYFCTKKCKERFERTPEKFI